MSKAKVTTLHNLARAAGMSFKAVQKAFAVPGAPARTRPDGELIEWLQASVPGAVKLPADLADRMIMIKFETAQERAKQTREAAEKLRLHNLERKGLLMERAAVRAQGAGIAILLSSVLSGWAKDLPAELVGKSELEITRTIQGKVDRLISTIREKLSKSE